MDMAQVRRAARVGMFVLIVLAVSSVILGALKPYTEYLWFSHDVRQPQVFTTGYETRGWLFIAVFFIAWGMLYGNLKRAFGATMVYLSAPSSTGQALIGNAVNWLQRKGDRLVWFGAPAFAFFTALGFSNEWNTFLLWRHGGSFGTTDPMYGLDLSFYVFKLPWYRALANGAFSLVLLTTVLTLGVYIGLQSLAALAKIELSRPGFRWHVNGLIGATLLALALQTWLKTYEAGLFESAQFTGAGYAMMQAIGATRIFVFLAVVLALATIFGSRWGKPYGIPMAGGIGLVAFYGLAVVAYPAIIQRLVVDPNRLAREAPYAVKAIQMTRVAYGLDQIETRDSNVTAAPTATEVQSSQATLDNMRLWDPTVLRFSLERQQAVRPYYSFPDVDIDRYMLNGKQTMVMVSARDLNLNGLDEGARNWTNERLRYTHGFGLTISQVNAASADGQPVFLAHDIPQQSDPQIPIAQPRIYFGDLTDAAGRPDDQYALVNTSEPELDFQTPTSSQTTHWEGHRGIPVGGLFSRLAFSITLGDGNLLVSGNVTGETRLLIHRNIKERASLAYPFLKFDRDPYVVVLDGKPTWVLDGYTLSDMVPYSQRLSSEAGAVNYIRNPAKITIDAYTGEINAYAVDPNEPILKAYREIYPGVVKDMAAMPRELGPHLRYPEDMFSLQCGMLSNYHVTDPTAFLSNSDAWDVAAERDLSGTKAPIRPYYVEMQLPQEAKPEFVQILPFTPRGRQTMSGWIAAHCDPGQYGKLTLFRFATGVPVAGPELMEGNFTSTPEISNINRQYNNEQSEIVVGNLLVIPIGQSVMYAESLYLRTKATGIEAAPRLVRVILALNDRIVVAQTYKEALEKLLGNAPPPPNPVATGTKPPAAPAGIPADVKAAAKETLEVLDQADQALRNGDFAKYGQLQKSLKARLQQMAH